MIGLGEDQNPIVVDFFAGSGTTAAAALQLSSETGRNLRWLLVQIADPCEDGSAAYRAGFATISDFTKERIRRAGRKILEGTHHDGWNRYVGFPLPNGRARGRERG